MAGKRVRSIAILLAGAACTALPTAVLAQDRDVLQFDLPAQDLGDALRTVAAKAGWELYASAKDVNGITAPRIQGELTARQAIEQLLADTNLRARFTKGAVIIRGRSVAASVTEREENEIVVTGSRIAGAPVTAPVIRIGAQDIKDAGQSDLGEVARSLPQNFGGGQNPGIGNSQGQGVENANVNGASTFNLRGIGPNATLTLLNGNRLSYSGVSAAIDVSAIPISAVDRIEIVADGASAIYGADAVAGVVNIILKKDFDGISTQARIGGSTDGGNFQQQYTGVGGAKWSDGGLIAVYDFFRNDAIVAGQRSYAVTMNPQSTLYPKLNRHNVLVSGHQDISSTFKLGLDALYKSGRMYSATGYNTVGSVTALGVLGRVDYDSFAIAPKVELDVLGDWKFVATGFFGIDNTRSATNVYVGESINSSVVRQYDNRTLGIETTAQGPLFALPGGDARLALGGGVRNYKIVVDVAAYAQHIKQNRNNYFAYAELFLPFIDAPQSLPLVRQLSLTGAVRYEDYSDSESLAIPKAGLIYEPVDGVTLRGSWGRSFKLPTLYQQYSGYSTVLLPVSGYGTTFPAGSTYVYALGANVNVGPERSENWTLSTEFTLIKGMEFSISYFHLDYTDRVAPPLASRTGALTNPLYGTLVVLNPSPEQISSLVSGAIGDLQNSSGLPTDPSRTVAILDGRDRNVARQIYHGFDLSGRYRADLGAGHSLLLSGAATILNSRQRLIEGAPYMDLAGTIFRPPHFKARGGATLSTAEYSVSAFASYTGSVTDGRQTTFTKVGSLTTFDFTGRVTIRSKTELSINIMNLLNAKPDRIPVNSAYDTPYDTTNYSSVGRYIGLSLNRSW